METDMKHLRLDSAATCTQTSHSYSVHTHTHTWYDLSGLLEDNQSCLEIEKSFRDWSLYVSFLQT